MAFQQEEEQESKTIPLKVLVDKNSNKVVFVEATKDFVDTIFSFLSLPLATIIRLLATTTTNNNDHQHPQSETESSPFLGNIKNLYQSVQNITSNDIWTNPECKQMLLHPRNPCESLCMKLFLNIDHTEAPDKIFVCYSCKMFTTFPNLDCTCGKPPERQTRLDSTRRSHTQHWQAGGTLAIVEYLDLTWYICYSVVLILGTRFQIAVVVVEALAAVFFAIAGAVTHTVAIAA
ncbi:hypothetical protein TSUD_263660 [Trifolium subterraneum]|uniref:Uncharacterized protein n=1 Tax=Trifolium subterraneum TaxID=3900 RepID=A0A2Z6NAE8_TRISU|nr:hypothetical protein TSUD_263660 [Trifolium subterraneum]